MSDNDVAERTHRASCYRARAQGVVRMMTEIRHPAAIGALRSFLTELELRAKKFDASAAALSVKKPPSEQAAHIP